MNKLYTAGKLLARPSSRTLILLSNRDLYKSDNLLKGLLPLSLTHRRSYFFVSVVIWYMNVEIFIA